MEKPRHPRQSQFLKLMVLLAGVASCGILLPFWRPLLWAAILAMTFEPLFAEVLRCCRGRRYLAAGVMVMLLLLGFLLPLLGLGIMGLSELNQGLVWLRETLGVSSLRDFSFQSLPLPMRQSFERNLANLHLSPDHLRQYILEWLNFAQKMLPAVLGFSLGAVLDSVLTLVAFFFFCVDGPHLVRYFMQLSPLLPQHNAKITANFRAVARGALLGALMTALMQSIIVMVGFALFGIPKVLFFGLLTLLLSFIPVVGASLVWLPAGIGLFLSNQPSAAIGLILYCSIFIFIADHTVKPWIMHGIAAMHAGLTFFAMLGGLATMGVLGIIVGPMVLALSMQLLSIYQMETPRPQRPAGREAESE